MPSRIEKASFRDFAQLDERYTLVKPTHKLAVFSQGILVMSKTFIGVIELDPRQLLEDGIRKELGREIENTLNNCIIFSAVQADEISDSGETTFVRFASILDSSLQGFISFPDLILQFENTCREVSELLREEANGRHGVIEDRFMR